MKKILCALTALSCCFSSCTKMDDEYKPYLTNGEIFYTGAPYNLETHAGRGRIEIQFTQSKDPNITRYVIYWNNNKNKLEVAPDKNVIQKVIVNDLPEGDYTFQIVALDKAGNSSTPGSAITTGSALGATYESNLLVRRMAASNSKAGIILDWASADTTCKYTMVSYVDNTNKTISKKVQDNSAFRDTLADIKQTATSLQLKTAYVPLKGIDTFYATQTVQINLAAAGYICTGSMTDYTSATLTGPYPWNTTLRIISLYQLELVDDDNSHDVFHKIISGGTASYYGAFGVVFNMDNTFHIISVVNKYGQPSSNGRSAELDPSGVNQFDPVSKTLKVKYWMNQPGATHRTSFDETFTMK
ncbi:DUF4998 domain-containing protein [Chitinophaga sp. RAB17]|uniref:DUF4998 domain-containing protein n=1 Tax=Chitinophaga sp. RAB17 TaxID=3233049 RepID=UPI003F93C6B3